ncbi:MAG: hypothetical protein KGJ07_07795, partial [Patescibacteria group bacterium]|nr:hypothetical protein [Patescibacteria group bacterium]
NKDKARKEYKKLNFHACYSIMLSLVKKSNILELTIACLKFIDFLSILEITYDKDGSGCTF